MKRNKELILENVGENAHTEASDIVLGEGILPSLLKKFKDVESLCKAYNSLESEFTKRCQRIKELEGEIEKLLLKDNDENGDALSNNCKDFENENANNETAKTVDNRPIDGLFGENGQVLPENNGKDQKADTRITVTEAEQKPQGFNDGKDAESYSENALDEVVNDKAETTDYAPLNEEDSVSEGETLNVVLKFFNECPSAVKYAEAFRLGGFRGRVTVEKLMAKYIGILLDRERELEEQARKFQGEITDEVRDRIIKEYLIATKPEAINPILNCQNGLIATLPPKRPKNLAEANALAEKIIKIK